MHNKPIGNLMTENKLGSLRRKLPSLLKTLPSFLA